MALLPQPIQMNGDEAQPGGRPQVPEQPRLDVLGFERLARERIILKVDRAARQVIGGPPVGVEALDVHHLSLLLWSITGEAAATSTDRSYPSRSPMRSTLTSAGGWVASAFGAGAAGPCRGRMGPTPTPRSFFPAVGIPS